MNYNCPVCFYGMDYPPKNWDICGCCGTEFENDDFDKTHKQLREEWIAKGANYWSNSRPKDWNGEIWVALIRLVESTIEVMKLEKVKDLS